MVVLNGVAGSRAEESGVGAIMAMEARGDGNGCFDAMERRAKS